MSEDGANEEMERPTLDLSSDCCDGGDGRGERCMVPAKALGLWRSANVFVLATGREAQMDGCSSSPTYHLLVLR